MSQNVDPPSSAPEPAAPSEPPGAVKPRRKRRWLRGIGFAFLMIVLVGTIVRAALPGVITWYVNRTLDQNPLYDGTIGGVDVHLYRGAYSITDVRLSKVTGNVPVPLFRADKLDLAISWNGLRNGKVVGSVVITKPEVNFVDDPNSSGDDNAGDQTGANGPWLAMLGDLFPFQIDHVQVQDGSVHFRTYPVGEKPVDVYLSELHASVDDLTNIRNQVTPMITTVKATGTAMGTGKFEYQMALDPFSYKPTFHMTTRLLNLDVTKLNDLTRTYGAFDFSQGWFDLVMELDANEGYLKGYVKPLFRDLKILTREDIEQDNVLQVFWEVLVGGAQELLKNHPRDQFGTLIPFSGEVDGPKPDVLSTIGNVLRNGFIRAYLPKLQQGDATQVQSITFEPPTLTDPVSVGGEP